MAMTHTCHAYGCLTHTAPRLFMCGAHWRALSPSLRDAVWREYRTGQERDKRPSARYMAVTSLAIESLIDTSDPIAEQAAAARRASADNWRRIAIHRGEGDPLEGLVPRELGL
jgi:hypothetical protein